MLDEAEYSPLESTLNSSIVSYFFVVMYVLACMTETRWNETVSYPIGDIDFRYNNNNNAINIISVLHLSCDV